MHIIVEACPPCRPDNVGFPSISFQIDPSGDLDVISSYDKLTLRPYQNYTCSFPQRSIESLDLATLCRTVAKGLPGFQGFVTLDLVTFPSPVQQGEILFWLIE
jgi:hypothetical protein